VDRYGHALVRIDPVAERKLRLKIDLMIVPTVAILYLFCFLDRSNIGRLSSAILNNYHIYFNAGNAKIAGLGEDLKLEGNGM